MNFEENYVCREKEVLSAKLNELKSELSTVTVQRDELEKCNIETRLQVPVGKITSCFRAV